MISEISKADEQAKDLIKEANLPPELEEKALRRWITGSERDGKKIDNDVKKKENSTREAYSKDEAWWKKHQVDRLKNRQSTEPSDEVDCGDFSSGTGDWSNLRHIELVVVPDNNNAQGQATNTNENRESKNQNPAKPVQPPGSGTTPTTTEPRRSERKLSTSLQKT